MEGWISLVPGPRWGVSLIPGPPTLLTPNDSQHTYGRQMGGTHLNGMLSCSSFFLLLPQNQKRNFKYLQMMLFIVLVYFIRISELYFYIAGYYQCPNITHIIRWEKICDGNPYEDCRDGSDELFEFCERYKCDIGMWKCASGKKCIREEQICDDLIDCDDRSDETFELCENWECPKAQIKMISK